MAKKKIELILRPFFLINRRGRAGYFILIFNQQKNRCEDFFKSCALKVISSDIIQVDINKK